MDWIWRPILRLILHLYPPAFRQKFGEEMADVFRSTAAEKRAQGLLALLGWLLVELLSGWRVALGLRLAGVVKGANMANDSPAVQNEVLPRWAVPVILIFFLFLAIPSRFYNLFPNWMSTWIILALALVTFVAPLVVGLATRMPRWSLLFTGAVLGGVGFFGTTLVFGLVSLLLNPMAGLLKNPVALPDTLFASLLYAWFLNGMIWIGTVLASVIFLTVVAVLRGHRQPFWQDFTLLSFSLYGSVLFNYAIAFDEYAYEELYVFASMLAFALGAWGYLRAQTRGGRTLALLAGLTAAMAVMGVGKYFLVPLQEWGPWLPDHPPESQRWFESLGTIAIWFWVALSIGLIGLLERRRPTPAALPPVEPV